MKEILLTYIGSVVYFLLVVPALMYVIINNCITNIFDLILYFSYIYFAYNIANKFSNWIKRKYNQ